MKKLLVGVILAAGLAVGGDKPSAADRVILLQQQVELYQAEVAKLRSLNDILEQQVKLYQNRAFEVVMKRAGCQALDAELKCAKGPVGEAPKPESAKPAVSPVSPVPPDVPKEK